MMRRFPRSELSAPVASTRRSFCKLAAATAAFPLAALRSKDLKPRLPEEVAGVAMPRSTVALRAAEFSRQSCPEFLFNHCMRTFLFGALALRRQNQGYNPEDAFVAAALHDLGLLPNFASQSGSFEVDGANAAEKFAQQASLGRSDVGIVWFSVALHDTRGAFTRHAGAEATLVSIGAGSDVDGPSLETEDERKQMQEVVAAFPRLQFKRQFTQLLIDHCKRKPMSQHGTWLEGLCRETSPAAWTDLSIPRDIQAAPFAE
jgi:hypothetical protein